MKVHGQAAVGCVGGGCPQARGPLTQGLPIARRGTGVPVAARRRAAAGLARDGPRPWPPSPASSPDVACLPSHRPGQMRQPGPDRESATSGAVLSRGAARGGTERKLQGHHRVTGPPGARLSSSVSTISPRANRHRTQCGGANPHAIVYRRTRTRKNNSNAIFLHECDIFLLTLRLRDIN